MAYLDCLGHNLHFEVMLASLHTPELIRKLKQLVAAQDMTLTSATVVTTEHNNVMGRHVEL